MCPRSIFTRLRFSPKCAESIAKIRVAHKPPTAITFGAAHRPSWAAPNRIFANFGLDFVRAHTGAEIPRLIIGAYMLETEPKIVPQKLT